MEIVLIHLNTKVPEYLRRNLIRLIRIFPDNKVVLISNIPQSEIENIEIKLFSEPDASKDIKINLAHPKEFRSNFWHTSIARFTYLKKYQDENQTPMLHVESDVILSNDFPIDSFKEVEGLAYPILSKFRGVASVFYSSGSTAINTFVEFLVHESQINHDVTDMTALRKFYDLNPKLVTLLPAGPADITCYEPEIVQDIFEEIKLGINKYGGVFDGSDIGLYLFGTDPRNLVGRTILRREIASTYTRMSKMKFIYNSTRQFLDVESQGKWLPVYSLHMTCKNRKLFTEKDNQKIFQKYLRIEEEKIEFLPRVYIRMAFAKILRTILSICK